MGKRIGPEMFAEIADKTQAEIEDEMAKLAPGGIPIVSGGEAPGSLKFQGPDILVVVTDTVQPQSREFLPVSIGTPMGSIERRIPLNTPTLVPEVLVNHLELNTLESNTKRIDHESSMWGNRAIAEAQNPGMRYVEQGGDCFLVRSNQRYIVRRLRGEELRA